MKSAFTWRPGFQARIDADVAGNRVDWLKQKRGGQVTPEDVLEDARAARSPLHDAFEWNNSKAAEAFRLDQARHLLGALIIDVKTAPGKPATPMRAFVNVTKHQESTYVGLQDAMSDKGLRAQVIDRAWRELLSWRDRYQEYRELGKMVTAIDHETRLHEKKAAE